MFDIGNDRHNPLVSVVIPAQKEIGGRPATLHEIRDLYSRESVVPDKKTDRVAVNRRAAQLP